MENKRKLVLAIDFNNIIYMSYYTKPLLNSHNINVNAVRGFFLKLKLLKETFNPDYIIFACDLSRELTFRRKMFPAYKGKRKATDIDIVNQMDITKHILSLLGFSILSNELYEADDILGMISRYDEKHGYDTIIISSDRDLYQLVTDHTFIMSPQRNELVDRQFMMDHYSLTPEQWPDLKILQGDKSDNIPGIPGIGVTTASNLMTKYGSIDNIYDHLDDFNTRTRYLLEKSKADIPLLRALVTIITDYTKIGMKEEYLEREEPYINEVMGAITEYELFSLANIMRFALFPQLEDKVEVFNHDGKRSKGNVKIQLIKRAKNNHSSQNRRRKERKHRRKNKQHMRIA